jgi:hypothetical protein
LSGSEGKPNLVSFSGLTFVWPSPTRAAMRISPTMISWRCSVGIRASSSATAWANRSRLTV